MKKVSQKQLEANRQNAKLGGVKTEEGKSVSKYNALKHGLLSKVVLFEEEDDILLADFGRKLRTELNPVTELELLLVDRIIANTWRLRRAMKIECEMMYYDCNPGENHYSPQQITLGEAFTCDSSNAYGTFVRYEASIERGIYKALHELQRIQAARNGEKPPAPIAIDVDISKD